VVGPGSSPPWPAAHPQDFVLSRQRRQLALAPRHLGVEAVQPVLAALAPRLDAHVPCAAAVAAAAAAEVVVVVKRASVGLTGQFAPKPEPPC
jgi:hypothetical protein